MIEAHDLDCGHGCTTILQHVSLQIQAGEMVGVLGPNGSGKTTLLLTLCGVLPPLRGTVHVDGHNLAGMSSKRRAAKSASVPQRLDAVFDMDVTSLVLMGRYPYLSLLGNYGPDDVRAAETAMQETGAWPLRHKNARALSGGELQRVLIARALAQSTGALFLDEASSGLDIGRKIEIHDLLLAKSRGGMAIVSAIHDLNLAAQYCSRLIFLQHGRIILDGPTTDVFTQDNLRQIYETPLTVFPHPVTGAPQCLPIPGSHRTVSEPDDVMHPGCDGLG
ncbi:ABC transporter ATP-binding protein [Desulfovibrio inopinatus]|uniref:ABC transporter ATP-binding protein n=1 Tax=Desulfovibrio inopinatus TaxID=102109 RepID=UPI0004148FFC|nr:ABC transporter ATP-binding protein [Desulfovibrio inopinatus]